MPKTKKMVLKLNKVWTERLIAGIISLGPLFAGLSFLFTDFVSTFTSITFIVLIISILATSIYLYLFQKQVVDKDKSKSFKFSVITVSSYLVISTIASIILLFNSQLAIEAYFFRTVVLIYFICSLIFWEVTNSKSLQKYPIYAFITGVSIASFVFLILNVIDMKSQMLANKELLAILAASVLGAIIYAQKEFTNGKVKFISFLLFVVNALTILFAQSIIALVALNLVVIVSFCIKFIKTPALLRDSNVKVMTGISFIILLLLDIVYVFLTPQIGDQLTSLVIAKQILTIDSILGLLLTSTILEKYLMKEFHFSLLSILIILIASLFTPLGNLTWIATIALVSFNISKSKD
jgi:hypothetical protein